MSKLVSPAPPARPLPANPKQRDDQVSFLTPRSLLLIALVLGTLLALFIPALSIRGSAALATLSSRLRPAGSALQGRPSVHLSTSSIKMTDQSAKKYTPAEERQWNQMATTMQSFHNHFRYEFNRVYTLADGGFHKEGMSLGRFLREAQQLAQHLTMHHSIEERYVFPFLGRKMSNFKAGARESGRHLQSHKAIHEGLDRYESFIDESLRNPSSYSAPTLREIMDGFREVLFRHLDEEVHDLQGENLKAAGWTLSELRQIPM